MIDLHSIVYWQKVLSDLLLEESLIKEKAIMGPSISNVFPAKKMDYISSGVSLKNSQLFVLRR